MEGSGNNVADAERVAGADEGMDDGSLTTLWEGHWSEGGGGGGGGGADIIQAH